MLCVVYHKAEEASSTALGGAPAIWSHGHTFELNLQELTFFSFPQLIQVPNPTKPKITICCGHGGGGCTIFCVSSTHSRLWSLCYTLAGSYPEAEGLVERLHDMRLSAPSWVLYPLASQVQSNSHRPVLSCTLLPLIFLIQYVHSPHHASSSASLSCSCQIHTIFSSLEQE